MSQASRKRHGMLYVSLSTVDERKPDTSVVPFETLEKILIST